MQSNFKSLLKSLLFICAALIISGSSVELKAAVNKDVILVLDTSLSMAGYGGRNIFNDVKLSVNNYIDTLQDGDRVTFVTFDSDVKVFPAVLVDDQNDRDILKKYISMVEAKGQWTYTLAMLKTVFALADELSKDKGKGKAERNLAIVIMTDALDDPPPGKRGDKFDLAKIAEQYSGKDWWIYLVNLAELRDSPRIAAAQEELRKELLKVSEKTTIIDGSDPGKAISEDLAQDIREKEIVESSIIPFAVAGFLLFLLLLFLFLRRARNLKVHGTLEYWNHELIKPEVLSVNLNLYGAKIITIGKSSGSIVKILEFESRSPIYLKAVRVSGELKVAVNYKEEGGLIFKNREGGELLENGDIFTVSNFSFRYSSG